MEEIIKQVILIDQAAKEIINRSENKKNYLDEYIEKEMQREKEKLQDEMKEKLQQEKLKYDFKLNTYKDKVTEQNHKTIAKMEKEYNATKPALINQIYSKVING